MKKLLLALTLLFPAILFAQSPFDGTWKTDMDKSKFSPKPIVFSTSNGMYDCTSCVPQYNVKTDGTDQSVTGQSYDTIAVKEVDPKSIQVTGKKNGKTSFEQTRSVSDDGKTLHVKTTGYPPDGSKPVMAEADLDRIGAKPAAGANATSGSWKLKKVKEEENGLLATYKGSGSQLTYSDPEGMTWTASMDGKDNPVKGTYAYDTVSVKQAGNSGIEVSYSRGGKLIEVDKITLSADGKTMTTVVEGKLSGRTSTYMAHKQ